MQATDSGVNDDRRRAISIARSSALCTIERLAADGFARQPLPFGFPWREGIAHQDVHERGWRSDGAWQLLRAAGSG